MEYRLQIVQKRVIKNLWKCLGLGGLKFTVQKIFPLPYPPPHHTITIYNLSIICSYIIFKNLT